MSDALTDIAIIGMAGRFPGAPDVSVFWRNLCAGVESIRHFSPAELEVDAAVAAAARMPNYVRARAIIEDADKFDAAFFGIYPKEAELIDPQQRIFLECCWHAFEDSGYDPLVYKGLTAVFAGCSFNSYFAQHVCADRGDMSKYAAGYQVSNFITTLGSNFEFLPTRVAYKLNLRGPAFSLNCGCSTSLVAVSQACLSLQNYQCDLALAGGVSITFPQKRGYLYEPGGMVSPDGHCRTFDAASQGTVFGDGAAVVLLKRLQEAAADGDQIYAVIKGFGVTNDGAAKVGFTAPGVDGQASAIAMAHSSAGVDPASISYIEAHGTGTPLGDPIEIAALTQAFRRTTTQRQFCALGTAKTNVGHLDVAAGVTGLIKTAMSLHHGMLPPTLHFEHANPKLNLEDSPFYVNAALVRWPRGSAPRRAGVSAFGIGGTNAHVVMEEAPEALAAKSRRGSHLLLISAKTESALNTATVNLATHLAANPATELADVAHTLMVGRHSFEARRMTVVHDGSDAVSVLQGGGERVHTRITPTNRLAVAFMFPGQGSQYLGMGRQLYFAEPWFREQVGICLRILAEGSGPDLSSIFESEDTLLTDEQINDTAVAQPALFIVEYALAQLWGRFGIYPRAMIGHSVGEFVAACVAGVFSLKDALRLVAARGALMHDLPRGAMLSVRLSEAEAARFIDDATSLAAVNGPSLTVLAGPCDTIAELEQRLGSEGIVCRRLRTSHAFHSSMMDAAREPLLRLLDSVPMGAPAIPFLSSVTGDWISAREATDADYWANHLRLPVRFSIGAAKLRAEDCALLEVGPGNILSMLARQHHNPDQLVIASMPDRAGHRTEEESVLSALGQLWLHGAEPDWPQVYADESRRRVSLPLYPFERKRFWCGAQPAARNAEGFPASDNSLVEVPEKSGSGTESLQPLPNARSDEQRAEAERPPGNSAQTMAIHLPETKSRTTRFRSRLEWIFEDLSGLKLGATASGVTFLELGFDSLFLTQISQALQAEFGIKITFRQLLDQLGTLEALAAYLDEQLLPEARLAEAADITPPGDSHSEPALPSRAEAALAAASITRELNLQDLFKTQLQALSDLMAKQLEVLRNTEATVRPAELEHTGAAKVVGDRAQSQSVERLNGSAAAQSQRPRARKFIPFGPVEADQARDLTPLQSKHLSALMESYSSKTAGSKRLIGRDRSHLADPRVASGFRLLWKEIVYPIVTIRSAGSKLWDIDGNEYIDLVNGYGPIMFGHAPAFVTDAVREQLDHGYETGPQSPLAGKVADLICEMTRMDRVTFCNTGSEAVTAALRVARTITARSKVVLFTGAYHGMFDEVVVKGINGPNGLRSIPVAPGIPREKVANVVVLDYGTPEALRYIEDHASELAAVLVEPVQSRHPALQPIEFLRQVRRITQQSGTALIFDEVVTGFRVHPGGCQALFGIKADLAIYGKVLGGGMPIGVLAGTSAFMDALDGGMWNYGDDSYPETGVTFFAGTFVRHPLALAATLAVLNHLKAAGPELWEHLADKTNRMADNINAFLDERQVPAHIDTFGSIAYFTLPAELTHAGLLYYYLRERGVHIQEGFPLFLTTAHSDKDIECVVRAFKESVLGMQAAEFLPPPQPAPAEIPRNGAVPHLNGNGAHSPVSNLTSVLELSNASAAEKPVPSARQAPLTESQKEIWLSAKLGKDASCCYNESFTLKMRGALNISALFDSIDRVIARHEALRAAFDADGEFQQFASELKLVIPTVDLSPLDEKPRQARLAKIIADDASTPFDLERGPLVRANLILAKPEEHHLIFTAHHIVCDGWSTNVILDELCRLYNSLVNRESRELPKAIPFGDYAHSQAAYFTGAEGTANQEYWTDLFKCLPLPLELPLDRPRSALRTYGGATIRRTISGDLARKLKAVGATHNCTLFVILLAALKVLLSRLSGQDDIVIGVPTAGQSSLSGKRVLTGHCVNFLPLRTSVPCDASMAAYLGVVKFAVLDAYDHQNYTYGRLVRTLSIVRDPCRLPLTDIQFNLERLGGEMKFVGLEAEVDPNPKSFVNQDLFLNVIESEHGLVLDCDYNLALFDSGTIERWLGHYSTLLESIADDSDQRPAELAILTDDTKHQLLVDWNDTAAEYPRTKLVHQLFEAQAARTPEAIAAVFEDERLTYAELNARANQLANYLRRYGVEPRSPVAIGVRRSIDMLVAILGALKAGCAYVPLDVVCPEERLRFILEETQPAVLLTDESLSGHFSAWSGCRVLLDAESRVIAAESRQTPASGIAATDRAYIIYTSGSTGTPKGVEVSHRAVVNLLTAMSVRPGFGASDILLAVTTLSFDIAGLELMLPLSVGGRVAIASREIAADGTTLLLEIRRTAATVVQATPITWKLLLEAGWRGDPPLKMLCGGEALPVDLAARLINNGGELWNMYGPTETTIWSAAALLTGENSKVTIGSPIANTQFYILDSLGQLAPIGVPGELYIGGDGIAEGYFKRPELTAQRFLGNPFLQSSDARLFRTGDLVRHLSDGRIEFLGRLDSQIKLRGYRIELGEIESTIDRHGAVKESAVSVVQDQSGEQRLAAYLVPNEAAPLDIPEIKEQLRRWLPEYMVPSSFVTLGALPCTHNGKLDRKALPLPSLVTAIEDNTYSKPRSREETTLCEIWAEVLGLPRVGIHDDIFALAGDSVHIFKIASRAAKAGLLVEPLQIFEFRTIAALVGHMSSASGNRQASPERSRISVVRRIGSRP